jgi:hypothetical protein
MLGTRYALVLTFTEPLLGTAPRNKEIYSDYIASRAPAGTDTADEEESLEPEKIGTGFHRVDGAPVLFDYHLRGFFKEAAGALIRSGADDVTTVKLKAYKKTIDGLVFVKPRVIPLVLPADGACDELERPLRAQTAQGERIALARSERLPAGTTAACTVHVLGQITEAHLREWLDYGAWRGLGQWRNGSYGRFDYTLDRA